MGERQEVRLDPAVLAIVGGGSEQDARVPGRRTKRRPSEVRRGERQLSTTFPEVGWCDAVRDLAARWGCRTGDVMVVAVARLLADVEEGRAGRPEGMLDLGGKAGEGWVLPWGV